LFREWQRPWSFGWRRRRADADEPVLVTDARTGLFVTAFAAELDVAGAFADVHAAEIELPESSARSMPLSQASRQLYDITLLALARQPA
jgi:hypothetical protein